MRNSAKPPWENLFVVFGSSVWPLLLAAHCAIACLLLFKAFSTAFPKEVEMSEPWNSSFYVYIFFHIFHI